MNHPILRPSPAPSEGDCAMTDMAQESSAYPKPKRAYRPGWQPTLVRVETFNKLRAIQKSTTDPAIDLSYLSDACLQMAMEMGGDVIVQRALAGICSARIKPST